MLHLRTLTFALLFLAAPAFASDKPIIAEPAEWVEHVAIPAADKDAQAAPVQPLLSSAQTRYGADETSYFFEYATAIQQPEALGAAGNVVIPWQPDRSELLVHKVHIVRDGKIIDLLANGQQFMVLRRENNLESAMLDGVLTAALQPEGLTVGDTLNVAFTIRTKPESVGFHGENMVSLLPGISTRRVYIREIWPERNAMRWKSSDAMGKPKLKRTRFGEELIVDLTDAAAPEVPADAPPRFMLPATLEVTEYATWNDVSGLLAPAYAKAQTVGGASPLQTEIQRIAASTQDPRARAMAALRLVQDQIRYLALAMGEGGYIPATAEETWSRKFGDCKGKTATLIALLQGLGIEAEPVLVSTTMGDSLGERLPMMRWFDHVIVRARIDGQSYWLDGTRMGDRHIEELASSPFGWGLPVRAAGAALEKLPLLPPTLPLSEASFTYDASEGFFGQVPISGELRLRGDAATMLRLGMAQMGKERIEEYLRQVRNDLPEGEEIDFDIQADDEQGSVVMRFEGKQPMDWSGSPGARSISFQFNGDTLYWDPDFERDEGAFKDLPFQLGFPMYMVATETVILPDGGKGFTLVGENIDRKVAGTHFTRTLTLENGRAVARSTFRRLQDEITADEARRSEKAIEEIVAQRAYVRSPTGYDTSKARDALQNRKVETAGDYTQRGYEFLQAGDHPKALADFDRAAALDPNASRPVANRAIVLIHQLKFDDAEAVLKKAASLDPDDFVVHQGYGMLYLTRGEADLAIRSFTRSLELDAGNIFNLTSRAAAYSRKREFDKAAADYREILRLDPSHGGALFEMARIASWKGNQREALDMADRMARLDPENTFPLAYRAELLERSGKPDEAAKAYGEALAAIDAKIAASPDQALFLRQQRRSVLAASGDHGRAIAEVTEALGEAQDTPRLLNERCWTRATANVELEQALADCNKALEIEPETAAFADSRALVRLRLGQFDAAIADADDAISWQPWQAASYYVRGVAKLRKGDRAGGEADLSTARKLVFDIDTLYEDYGITP